MVAQKHPSLKRRRRSGGNVIIESVFTLIPTFAIILAFIDFGLMIYRWTSLQNAVRAGVRYAITMQTEATQDVPPASPATSQSESIKNVVARNAMNVVTAASPNIYVKFFSPAAPDTQVMAGGNVPGNIVEVSVQGVSYSYILPVSLSGSYSSAVAPLYRDNAPVGMRVFALDLLGGYPVGVSEVAE